MADRIPLAEQLEELEAEWDRRNRDYPILESRGEMRHETANLKQDRLAAAINTLAWLKQHRDVLKEFLIYGTRVGMRQPVDEPVPEPEFEG